MTTTTRNFLGIPVEGDIDEGSKKVDQRPLSELEPIIRALLDDELIVEFGWTQYTPYFNDGDPCVFRVGTPWFRTTEDAGQDEDDEEDGEDLTESLSVAYGEHPTLGERERRWNSTTREYETVGYKGNHEATHGLCVAYSDALDSNAFDDVLLDAFGDHCSVVVRRDGITVETYEHD